MRLTPGMRLTKAQKRELANWQCCWCDHPLNQPGCGAIYGRCKPASREARINRILAGKEDPDPFKLDAVLDGGDSGQETT